MRTKDEINQEISEVRNELRAKRLTENIDTLVGKLKSLEDERNEVDRFQLVRGVNAKQARLRDLALQAWNCEQVGEDITISGGYFHKTKVKKYPVLASLGENVRAKFEGKTIKEITISGESFYMVKSNYEYGKETTYTRYTTFEEFLNANSILLEDLTIEQFKDHSAKLQAYNTELKQALDKYSKQCEDLGMYLFGHIGLSSQRAEHLYIKSFNS